MIVFYLLPFFLAYTCIHVDPENDHTDHHLVYGNGQYTCCENKKVKKCTHVFSISQGYFTIYHNRRERVKPASSVLKYGPIKVIQKSRQFIIWWKLKLLPKSYLVHTKLVYQNKTSLIKAVNGLINYSRLADGKLPKPQQNEEIKKYDLCIYFFLRAKQGTRQRMFTLLC